MNRRVVLRSMVLGLALLCVACGSSTRDASALQVKDAWARATVTSATNASVYMTIVGGATADVLTGATVSSSIAGGTMLHKTTTMTPTTGDSSSTAPMGDGATTMAPGMPTGADSTTMPMGGDSSTSTMAMSGSEMGMVPISHLDIPKHKTVEFAPGAYHVMLDPIMHQLKVGTTFKLTLHFEHAGDITVPVKVRT